MTKSARGVRLDCNGNGNTGKGDMMEKVEICPYCCEESYGYVKPLENNCHAFIRFGVMGWEIVIKAKGWHGSAKIRYCPMCGRKLMREGEKDA